MKELEKRLEEAESEIRRLREIEKHRLEIEESLEKEREEKE